MKHTIFIFMFLALKITDFYAQPKSFPTHDKKFSFQIEEEIKNKKLRKSAAAYYYTYIGQYNKALENYEVQLDWNLDTIGYQDSLNFLKYQPVNATEYLKKRTKEEARGREV